MLTTCTSHCYSLVLLRLVGQIKGHSARALAEMEGSLRLVLSLEIYMSAFYCTLSLNVTVCATFFVCTE